MGTEFDQVKCPLPLGRGSQANWCELMAIQTLTVNHEFALGPTKAPPPLLIRTIRVLHQFTTFGGWEWRFTTLTGAIHNLVHNFWQGNGSNGHLC